MVKAALVGLLTALLAISSGNLAIAQTGTSVATVGPAGVKTKATTAAAVVPKTATAATKSTTTTATTGTTSTSKSTTSTTAKTATTAKTTPATAKTLSKSKSSSATATAATGTTATDAKKTLKKSSSTNTRVVPQHQPSNGLPNWVGPKVGAPTGAACYRKTHFGKTCAPGFYKDPTNIACWAECPLEYPIQCGMECIPQNKDCTKEYISKIGAVANAALSTATVGVFGQLTSAVKIADVTVRCGKQLYDIVQKLVEHIDDLEAKSPSTTKQKLLAAVMKSDFALIDLPLAITTCIGLPIANAFSTASDIVSPVKSIIQQVLDKRAEALEPKVFVNISSTAGVAKVGKMPAAEVSKLDKAMTCGGELKGIVDKVVAKVREIKEQAPTQPVDAIRLALASSELFLVDIPQATNDCIPKGTKDFFELRNEVRKSFQTILDKVIDSSSEKDATKANAKETTLSKKQYALKIAGFGLDVIAMFDPTGMANLARKFIQKICGPTQFMGEIDDGPLEKSLGLHTIGEAFDTSDGAYKKKGDGFVQITFISNDKENVEINIFSGGKQIDTVKLENGVVKKWKKPMKDMQDKTLYLDRWRPGFLRIPGTGGGSLLMWIPHSAQGGHVDLTVSVNVS